MLISNVSNSIIIICLDSGYAFSQEQGQDKLVTDNLTNRFKEAISR